LANGANLLRNSWRARLSRDITVPISKSNIPATSRQVNPSTTHNKSTVLCSIGNAASASEIFTASGCLALTELLDIASGARA